MASAIVEHGDTLQCAQLQQALKYGKQLLNWSIVQLYEQNDGRGPSFDEIGALFGITGQAARSRYHFHRATYGK